VGFELEGSCDGLDKGAIGAESDASTRAIEIPDRQAMPRVTSWLGEGDWFICKANGVRGSGYTLEPRK
jgi:hypothetical protein